MPAAKRVWSEFEIQQWKAQEQLQAAEKKAKVDALAAGWNSSQSQPFRRNFLGPSASCDMAAAQLVRQKLGIEIQADAAVQGLTPAPMQSWSEMSMLPAWIEKSLQEHRWEAPMPVQAQSFPILLGGHNLIGIAQTGSGKTIAFMLPAVIHAHDQRPLGDHDQGPIVLVLAPTRELAVQIGEETEKLTKYSWESENELWTTCFYGGGKKKDQLYKFSNTGSHFVVATPGRLLDCIAEGSVSLGRVTYFCLDEADRMLDMGFLGDMEQLSSTIRPDKQMAFFSATWPSSVQSLAYNLSTSGQPMTIRVAQPGRENSEVLQARESIHQEVVMIEELEGRNKWGRQDEIKKQLLDAHLKRVMASDENSKVLIFVNDKIFADELSRKLWDEGVAADCIHGGRQQEKRLEILDCFRQGTVRILVATDVIGRGLDIPNVTHVVVYAMNSVQDYIHRIGRTGRGKDASGHALVFFEYSEKNTAIAGELVDVLKRSKQVVPPELQKIADEVASGVRQDFYSSWGNNGGNGWKSNGWNKSNFNDWNSWEDNSTKEWKST